MDRDGGISSSTSLQWSFVVGVVVVGGVVVVVVVVVMAIVLSVFEDVKRVATVGRIGNRLVSVVVSVAAVVVSVVVVAVLVVLVSGRCQ